MLYLKKLVISISTLFALLLATDQLRGQAPGGVDHYLTWEKDYDSGDFITEGSALFNFHPYNFFDDRRTDYEIQLKDLEKVSLFMVFSSLQPAPIAKLSTDNGEINITDKAMGSTIMREYLATGPKPKFIRYVESMRGQERSTLNTCLQLGDKEALVNYIGGVAEVILYDRLLSKPQRRKVESYLSLKYGISLPIESEYVNGRGAVIWDPEQNEGYQYNLTALGRDDLSGLYQKQSHNLYADTDLTIGWNTIAELNKDNVTKVEDGRYLFWSDDNKLSSFLSQSSRENSETTFLERTWKLKGLTPQNSESDFTDLEISVDPSTLGNYDKNKETWVVLSYFSKQGIDLEQAEYYKLSINDNGRLTAKLTDAVAANETYLMSLMQQPELYVEVELSDCADSEASLQLSYKTPTQKRTEINLLHKNKVVSETLTKKNGNIIFENLAYGDYTMIVLSNGTEYLQNISVSESNCKQQDMASALYPSPVLQGNEFTLELRDTWEEDLTFTISTMDGKIVKQEILKGGGDLVYRDKIATAGHYLLAVTGEQTNESFNLIVVEF